MKSLKKFVCILFAGVICFSGLAIHADADDMDIDTYYVFASEDNSVNVLPLILVGSVVLLAAISAVMAVLFVYKSKKKRTGNKIVEDTAVQADENVVFCSKCGTKHSEDSVFCCKCGAKLFKDNDQGNNQ